MSKHGIVLFVWIITSSILLGQGLSDESWSASSKAILAKAKNDNSIFQLLLGELLLNGNVIQGVQKDPSAAAEWLKKAADNNLPKAQVLLGQMMLTGEGVPKNEKEAIRLFRVAADAGNARGQYALGKAYDDGQGVSNNPAEALRLYRAAAEAGSQDAQFTLARCFQKGRLVKANKIESQKWLELAAAQGHPEAFEILTQQRELGELRDRQAQEAIVYEENVLDETSEKLIRYVHAKYVLDQYRRRGPVRPSTPAEIARAKSHFQNFIDDYLDWKSKYKYKYIKSIPNFSNKLQNICNEKLEPKLMGTWLNIKDPVFRSNIKQMAVAEAAINWKR